MFFFACKAPDITYMTRIKYKLAILKWQKLLLVSKTKRENKINFRNRIVALLKCKQLVSPYVKLPHT